MSDIQNLEPGDFVYQSDQELFLVVIGETETSYKFAVHGWRNIDKERLDEYVSHDNGKLYQQSDVEEALDDNASDEQREQYEVLQQLFNAYADADISEEGPHTDFALEDK
jgi:hypothetical protein